MEAPGNIMEAASRNFINTFNILAGHVHATAKQKGWWDNDRNDGEVIALIHSELSEALESLRAPQEFPCKRCGARSVVTSRRPSLTFWICDNGHTFEGPKTGNIPPDDKIPEFSGVEAELADVIVRIMDMACARGWRVGEAIVAKMAMNKTRPRMHGGKAF